MVIHGESGLETVKRQLLEQRAIVAFGRAPLLVMIRQYSGSTPGHGQRANPSAPVTAVMTRGGFSFSSRSGFSFPGTGGFPFVNIPRASHLTCPESRS